MSKKIISIFLSLTVLTACSDYDLDFSETQISFASDFSKSFGKIDPAQDFNLASRVKLSVTPGTRDNIKIYAKVGINWQLVADYHQVTAEQELGFDVPQGTTELLVTDGIRSVATTPGASVSLAGTRSGRYDFADGEISMELNEGDRYTYYYYDKAKATEFRNTLPETKDNRGVVTQDFLMTSTGEFIVYPTYWYADDSTTIYLYYYDDLGNRVHKKLFSNYAGNESVQYLDPEGNWTTFKGIRKTVPSESPFAQNYDEYRSKGIIVDLPVGTVFGFSFYTSFCYHNGNIVTSNSQSGYPSTWTYGNPVGGWWFDTYICSESELNPFYHYPDTINENVNFRPTAFATYFDNNGDMVVGLEDHAHFWNGATGRLSKTDWDFNDIVFKIYGSVPEVLDNSAQSWILPFEDLGGSHDWDYNDVVLKMRYVSGRNTATITPLAAGGTLHSEVFFNDTDDESLAQDLGEIHVLLGAEAKTDKSDLYTPINAATRGKAGTPINVVVHNPTTFSIANALSDANASGPGTSTKSILGTYIVTSGTRETSVISSNGAGKVPAMLVIPEIYEKDDICYEWAWPTENTDIRTAYGQDGHCFADWVNDHTKAIDWYKYPTGKTVEEKSAPKFKNTLTPSPEYVMADYGTIVTLPQKNEEGNYEFNSRILEGLEHAEITAVFKGVGDNALMAYNSVSQMDTLGCWSRLDREGRCTIMGNNACGHGTGSSAFEGIYRIELSREELASIRSAGNWMLSASDSTAILYMAIH